MSQTDTDRLQYYSRKVKSFRAIAPDDPDPNEPKVHPSTYIRIAQLQSSALFPSLRRLHYDLGERSISHIFLFVSPLLESLEFHDINGEENTIIGPFLFTLSSQLLNRIVLSSNTGRMSADILKKSIVHFKHLRSLVLLDAVFMDDFSLLEVLGTLPSLEHLTLEAHDPASHPAQAPENSNSKGGGRKYFDALESISVTGSIFLIQHLLGFIDSPCLKLINASPVINHVRNKREPDHLFTPFMTIVASKWSQSLTTLVIGLNFVDCYAISNCLMLLTYLHEMQESSPFGWNMGNMDDDVRRLVMSWPKLRTLSLIPLNQASISLSTLRIIAENCPELRYLRISLDISNIPPFDTSGESLRHNLEVLDLGRVYPYTQTTSECRIQVARYLDLILKSVEVPREDVTWSGIRDMVKLCQEIRRVN